MVPISGAHLNPVVTLADATQGGIAWRDVLPYISAQIAGAFGGVAAADVMFGEPVFSASRHVRSGAPQMLSEFIATFGLLAVIWGVSRKRPSAIPFAVGSYNRQRAFTLFVTAYDQIRRAISYLRWNEDDVDQIAPSLYAGRNTGRRKSPDAQPTTPATPASPAAPNASTAASTPSNGSPAVAVGHPQSSPFTSARTGNVTNEVVCHGVAPRTPPRQP